MTEIDRLRFQFQEIDKNILSLLGQRKELAIAMARLKKEYQMDIVQEDAWNKSLQCRLEENIKIRLDEEFVIKLFEFVHSESIRIQQREIL